MTMFSAASASSCEVTAQRPLACNSWLIRSLRVLAEGPLLLCWMKICLTSDNDFTTDDASTSGSRFTPEWGGGAPFCERRGLSALMPGVSGVTGDEVAVTT